MAVDKLVDSAQLDSDLEDVADAIRAKGGTSAQLAFPNGFISAIEAIPTGGGSVTTVTFGDDAVFMCGYIIGYVDGNGAFQHATELAVMSEVSYQMLSGSMLVWCSTQDPSMSGEITGTITGMSLAYSVTFGSGFNALYFRFYLVD